MSVSKFNADSIRHSNLLSAVISDSGVELRKNGAEFTACCPFHNEKTPSFSVSDTKEFYFCFGCGASGDVIGYVMDFYNVKFPEACEILGGQKDAPNASPVKIERDEPEDIYQGIQLIDIPKELELSPGKDVRAWNPKRSYFGNYKPSMVFPYLKTNGDPWFYVLRIEINGKKITPVIAYCRFQDGSENFSLVPAPDERPLYRPVLDDKQILLVEGEKSADAAHRIVGDALSVNTWCGGGKAIKKTDWSCIKGRSVVIWPDADKPGVKTAKELALILSELGCTVKIIDVPDNKDGWDAADAEAEGWDRSKFIQWAKESAKVFTKEKKKKETKPKDPKPSKLDKAIESTPKKPPKVVKTKPYKVLGYNNGVYYYLPDGTQQIIAMTLSQHTQSYFLGLAPSHYWLENFSLDGKKIDWQVVADALIRASEKMGIFDSHERLRGRGAWRDDKRTIMHLGTHCYVDAKMYDPSTIDSKFIYQAQTDVGIELTEPLGTQDAIKLFRFCQNLSWENDLSAALLAGWCVVAPLSGILKWRPHIWVTGPAGSGKSTVMYDIIGAVLGKTAIHMEGAATEAGIRQKLHQDARPVVFDEAEAEEARDAIRMQEVLNLARISSSGGRVIKGGKDGKSQSFSVRSCFCFSSINTSVKHFADETRISKLILKIDHNPEAESFYADLEREITDTLNPEFSAALLSRSLKNMDSLEANIESFRKAATKIFKSRRIADQIGTLLAGTYLLHSSNAIGVEEAEEFILRNDWSEHTAMNEKSDPERLLDKISTFRIVVNTMQVTCKPSLGELILKAAKGGGYVLNHISQDQAEHELKLYGIKCEDPDSVTIANTCDPLKRILKDTPWHSNWSRPMKEIEGSELTGTKYFSPGIKSRGTKIPLTMFTGD